MLLPLRPDAGQQGRPSFGARGPAQSYDRFLVRFEQGRLTAQVVVVPRGKLRMSVRVHDEALAVDFTRHQVTDPDRVDSYRDRPGYYLHEELSRLVKEHTPAILLNGNNIGYWGNQFVIQNRKIRYKRRGPIFDDGKLHAYATDKHAFFLGGGNRFRIESLALVGTPRENGQSLISVAAGGGYDLPRFGLSGFPLMRGGQSVWEEHAEYAWDPCLLYDFGRISEFTAGELRKMVREMVTAKAPLARHPMTVIGIDESEQVVLLVVERSEHSRGMTVAEAADLLRRRFAVRDAIVLGAAGDAQLATTEEGVLTEPFVAPYARHSAREIPDELLGDALRGRPVWARPVPSYVEFRLCAGAHAHALRLPPSAEPAGMA